MKYINIFHANLNYAYLTPDMYEFVIRVAYEMTIETMRDEFPDAKYVFEASGYTIEQMAFRTPDVLEKLKDVIKANQCEFMGSPYAHPMLPNFPQEDGLWSLKFSNNVYKKYLGVLPKSFWNPECGWRSYVPKQVVDAGYKNIVGDFEAYSIAKKPDGTPQRPEIYEVEYTEEKNFYNFGSKYNLPGDENALHFPFENIQGVEGKLRTFLRSDRVCQFGVRYFMDMEGYSLDEYMDLIKKYSQQPEGEPEGALVIFADDAEYIGTNGWFKLKFMNQPDNVFEAVETARQKLIDLMTECQKLGEFITFDDACNNLPTTYDTIYFDDDAAWHGARASVWAETPMARLLRPWQDLVREKLNASGELSESEIELAWYHLTSSYNSDGQWPPTLPHAPHIIHPFNYGYCFDNLLAAEMIVGGVDRSKLDTDPTITLKEILSIQQDLVLAKVEKIMADGTEQEKADSSKAKSMVLKSRNYDSIINSGAKVLYASEYTVRAEALAQSRRMVGGVRIEEVSQSMKKE